MYIQLPQPVAITHTYAISPFGQGSDALCLGLAGEMNTMTPNALDAIDLPRAIRRHQKRMSPAATLACLALTGLLEQYSEPDTMTLGYFLGVGASGGDLGQLHEMLRASQNDDQFDEQTFGTEGLRACNPLFAFQLMNNFTLCHGAILNHIGGPNAAIFSRGQGTVLAMMEAAWSIIEQTAHASLCGGADCAIHQVTQAELKREGITHPTAQGVGLLRLGHTTTPEAWITGFTLYPNQQRHKTDHHTVTDDVHHDIQMPYTLAAHPALLTIWGAHLTKIHPRVDVVTCGADGKTSVVHLSQEPAI